MASSRAARSASRARRLLVTLAVALGLPSPTLAVDHPPAAGEWHEEDGPCPGAVITVAEEAGQVVSIRYVATCSGLPVSWTASNIRWSSEAVLSFDYHRAEGPAGAWADGSAHLILSRSHGATLSWRNATASGMAQLRRPGEEVEDEANVRCFCVK